MDQTEQAPDFEQALAALEAIVERLEHEELSLEQSLALFEEGIGLARFCARRLDEAERKIELLIEKHGEVVLASAPELEVDERAEDATA